MELETLVDFAGTAKWREQKAENYPWDSRNKTAVQLLKKYSEEAKTLVGTPVCDSLSEVFENWPEDDYHPEEAAAAFNDEVNGSLRSVGFGYAPADAAAFIEDLVKSLRSTSDSLWEKIEKREREETGA